MEFIPISIFWVISIWGFFSKPHNLLYIFFGSISFGSLAVIPTELTGGLTLTPSPIVALLIIYRTLFNIKGFNFFISMAFSYRKLQLLFIFWIVCLLTTIFSPNIFSGMVEVYSVRSDGYNALKLLEPSYQNFSQLAYLTISIFSVFAFLKLLSNPQQRIHAWSALCFGALIVLTTGFLDFFSQYFALNIFLEPLRTATYALLTDVTILDTRRVIGLMPEASSFGSLCIFFLSFLYFLRPLISNSWLRNRICPILIIFLIFFVCISTSSAAYISLSIFFVLAIILLIIKRFLPRPYSSIKSRSFNIFWILYVGLFVVCLVFLLNPSLFDTVIELLDELIFKKTESESFVERSQWTKASWDSLFNTWGLGVGIGSTRSSNFAAAIFSNTGVIGGILYFSFLINLFFKKPFNKFTSSFPSYLMLFLFAFIPGFVTTLLIGTTADFGLIYAFLYGLLLSIKLDDTHCV